MLHFGKVLLSCRFESNTDARKDLPVIVQVTQDRRKFLYLPYSDCLKQSTNLKLSNFTVFDKLSDTCMLKVPVIKVKHLLLLN